MIRAVFRSVVGPDASAVKLLLVGISVLLAGAGPAPGAASSATAEPTGCAASDCHGAIEDIREPTSQMMRDIVAVGRSAGDPRGCVVCHGGDPTATTAEDAHRGAPQAFLRDEGPEGFYPDPGSPWINAHTCGMCHDELVRVQWTSLMMTEAGKIQGVSWSFGALQGYRHGWGNYDVKNPDDPEARRGTPEYRELMQERKLREPGAYPDELRVVPEAPTDLAELKEHPERAAFTYIRSECERCHLAVRGRETRGGYRGMGCSACHIPYGNEGLYEGADPTIPRDRPRHLLVHSIQSTRDAKVTVNGQAYSGIPVETCTTCHDRGKRIGVTFQGLMESAYTSPNREGGDGQLDLHTKHYLSMSEDVHYQKGMMCQDCHTSICVHGDGFLAGTNLAQVQIECADCHGTPWQYPWELPLGYGDEFDVPPKRGAPRGVATQLSVEAQAGTPYPVEDGYLLTARGNPFGEVVRRGNRVVVHTAGGKDLELDPLKLSVEKGTLPFEALVAMREVRGHVEGMECYACHSTWAPQCYGCHLKIDYSEGRQSFDWVRAGHLHTLAENAADAGETGYPALIPGKAYEQRSYMRFEDPALAVNGEGRICPAVPGCQPSVTVIGADGETLLLNHIFRTPSGLEGSGDEGQLCIDMSPGQPHTTGRARSCESCHASDKALGYGIGSGRIFGGWNRPVVVDLMTADHQVLPRSARVQIEAIDGLADDWSRFVSEDGRQLMTVGHHFSLSRPLNDAERARTSREGVCLACHREIPSRSLAVSLLHHAAEFTGTLPESAAEHDSLVHKVLLFAAWGQTLGPVAIVAGVVLLLWLRRRRHRPSPSRL